MRSCREGSDVEGEAGREEEEEEDEESGCMTNRSVSPSRLSHYTGRWVPGRGEGGSPSIRRVIDQPAAGCIV